MRIPRRIAALAGAIVATIAFSGVAVAASGYTLFGDAQYVSPGNASARAVQIRSDATIPPAYGGVDFAVPSGTTFAQFETLGTDYWFEADDSCGGGSPRFQVNVEKGADSGNIFVYLGPPPNYTLCAPSVWTNSGDLLEGVNLIDTSQLPGGNFYDPYAAALARYGDYAVTGVQLVADGSWFPPFGDGEQTARVDNTNIDGTVYTYEKAQPQGKDDCKNGGWQELARADGTTFKNQGDCIQYVNTGK